MKKILQITTVLFIAIALLAAYTPQATFAYDEVPSEEAAQQEQAADADTEESVQATEAAETTETTDKTDSHDQKAEIPSSEKAAEGNIRIIVENNQLQSGDGAPWTGILIDKTIKVTEEETIGEMLNEALKNATSTASKYDDDGVKEINGLSDEESERYEWIVKINNEEYKNASGEFDKSSVKNGDFEFGDVLSFEYTEKDEQFNETQNNGLGQQTAINGSAEAQGTDDDYDWYNFRNSDVNMAVTDRNTPVDPETTGLQWFADLGDGSIGMFGSVASPQIIVNGKIVAMSGMKIYMVDEDDGTILKQANLEASTGFSLISPIYIEEKNMIVCALGNGTVQAFDSGTLKSLWVYKDPLGGQANTPVTYSNGCIYTGFWISGKDTNFVCIDINDEDVSQENEAKESKWVHKQMGGFYWTGAVVVGDNVIVGTDENNNKAYLYAINTADGSITSTIDLENMGGQRSSIAYDRSTRKIYFTTSGGYICDAMLDSATGAIDTSTFKSQKIAESVTSTPVIYKNVVYVGSGESFNSGRFVACDADSLKVLYEKPMKGFVKSSFLMSTAYSGYLYFYSSYNYPAGGITAIKVKLDSLGNPDRAGENTEVTELYDASDFSQYSTASIICNSKGNLIYRNDTGFIQSVGKITPAITERLINNIGEVSLTSERKIKAARNAYEKLKEADKAIVNNYDVLTTDEYKLAKLKENNGSGSSSDPASQTAGGSKTLGTSFSLKGKTKSLSLTLSDKEKSELAKAQKQKTLVPGAILPKEDSANETGYEFPWMWIYAGIGMLALLLLIVLIKKKNEIR